MRMTPEEKQELDAWVEKEYPKSMERINTSDPFHRIGKKILATGVLSYILFVLIENRRTLPSQYLFLTEGMNFALGTVNEKKSNKSLARPSSHCTCMKTSSTFLRIISEAILYSIRLKIFLVL